MNQGIVLLLTVAMAMAAIPIFYKVRGRMFLIRLKWIMRGGLLACCVLFTAPCVAQAERSLYWEAVEVQAHLDANGSLQVSERQLYVYNGDWNGGYRNFKYENPQDFSFHSIKREDADTNRWIILEEGDVDIVDHYLLSDNMLRWRSRLPSDPPFHNTTLNYVLEYTYWRVLRQDGDVYVLNHDFVFPDRDAEIRRYTLNFTVDPAWQAVAPFAGQQTYEHMGSGASAIVNTTFRYVGSGKPGSVVISTFSATSRNLGVALLVVSLLALVWFFRHEKNMGVFEAITDPQVIDETWLSKNLFSMLPEVVGALWDKATVSSGSEIPALLARMELEGKLRSKIKDEILHLDLLVPRNVLSGHEALLVNSLFVEGDHTNTLLLSEHYQKTGFNPKRKIAGGMRDKIRAANNEKGNPIYGWVGYLVAGIVSLTILDVGVMQLPNISGTAVFVTTLFSCLLFIPVLVGLLGGRYPLILIPPRKRMLGLVVKTSVFVALISWLMFADTFALGLWAQIGLFLLSLTIVNAGLKVARSNSREYVKVHQNLLAVRAFFQQELTKQVPRIKDAWYPYLVALQLTGEVDHWLTVHGVRRRPDSTGDSAASATRDSSFKRPDSFTGGSGSFGGAGASAGWASAAAEMSDGVHLPTSSSNSTSSSSSSSGGSSSGGGGGGGW